VRQLARTVDFGSKTSGPIVAAVHGEDAAVRDAIAWSLVADPCLALEICTSLSPFWFGTMRVSVGWELLFAALAAADTCDPALRSSALAWAAAGLITLIGAPFGTGLADSTGRHKLIMSLGLTAAIVVVLLLPSFTSFAVIFILIALFNIFMSPVGSLCDSATISMLGEHRAMYGRIRLGGTLGWGLFAPIAGALVLKYGLNIAFWVFAGIMFLSVAPLLSAALAWTGAQSGKWFAWVHVFDPHSPYKPPADLAATYSAQPYDGEVAFVDRALGPLFDRLATLPRPTLVVVTSDHGESLGEHGEMTHGMFAYEATLRVPLILARVEPRTTPSPRGVVIDTPARHVDIAPTVLEAVGVAAEGPFAGTSLKEVVRSGRGDDRPAYFESMTYNLVRGWAPLRGVLVKKDKYVDQPIPEMYDLAGDPQEEKNLAPQQAERVQVLVNVLRSFNVAPPDRPGRESAEVAATLRSLGYVSGSAPERKVFTEADDLKNLVHVDRDLHKASELYQDGKVQDAIAVLNSVIARRPDTADAYISLAHAYWESGQLQPAIATLETALANGAPDRDVRIRLGIYLAESQTDPARAIKLLEGLPVSDVEALNGLGVAYGGAGRYADAIQAFKKVLVLDPTNGLAYQNLASMVLRQALAAKNGVNRAGMLQEAERYARQAIDTDPSLPKAYTTLGVVLAESGRKREAIDSWKRAVALDGREFDALYNLTILLLEARQTDDARVYAKQFVATAPPALYGPSIQQMQRFLSGS
jgi:tetratricopeptide (TPR) repeat protein